MKSLNLLAITIAIVAILAGCGGTDEAETTRAGGDAPAVTQEDAHDGHDHAHDASPETALATCDAHGASAALCYFCDASLRDSARLWCNEHDRYEDRCFICHPEIRDASRLYCEEHGTYEDECFICHPDLFETKDDDSDDGASTGTLTGAIAASISTGLYCNEHDVAENECGICHPELADKLIPGAGLKIRFPSTASASKAGITASHPTRENAPRTVSAVGELGYDLNRLVRVTPLVDGVVRDVHVDLGSEVKAGQALVSIASPHIAQARADYLETTAEETVATQSLERDTRLFEKNAIAEQHLVESRGQSATASARRHAAEQNLLDLGFTAREVASVRDGGGAGSTAVLRAPFAATVVARNAVRGDVVSLGTELVRLADTGELWLTMAVSERDVAGMAPGQRVAIRSETTGQETSGTVTWVSTHLNETTRMAEVRAVIPNLGHGWKAGMFVTANVHLGPTSDALSVAADAVHRFGGAPFVFVEVGDGLFEVRRIDLLATYGDRAFVSAGLSSDERVVTSQSFLVKSEFQKSRLGAGCVD